MAGSLTMTMKESDTISNQAAPTMASLMSLNAAHIFDNAAVEYQLSADREEMVAPGKTQNRGTYTSGVPETQCNSIISCQMYREC